MSVKFAGIAAISTFVLLAGCATQPLGPTIPVMPAQGKSLTDFQKDEDFCEQYAFDRVSGRVKQANDEEFKRGVIGAAIGAGLGALVGNTKGALVGGTAGALIGGSSRGGYDQYGAQRRYDIAYAQCMTARGNQVPAQGEGPPRRHWHERDDGPPPPDDRGPPPPPPGY